MLLPVFPVTTREQSVGGKTYNELAALVKEVLLQRSLMWALGWVGPGKLRTNLVLHHCVADIVGHTSKLIRNLSAGQKLCDLALLC